jgi:hypothetical protein
MIIQDPFPAEEPDTEQRREDESDDDEWTFPFSDWTFSESKIKGGQ